MPGFGVGFKPYLDCPFNGNSPEGGGKTSTNAWATGTAGFELSHTTETARDYRYSLSLDASEAGASAGRYKFHPAVTVACESIDRPILRIEKERVWNGADYINVPLRGEYDTISATLYEILRDKGVDSSNVGVSWTMEAIVAWWTNSAFSFKHSRTSFPDARRVTATIRMLNGLGDSIWAYRLHHCWPEAVTPSRLSYDRSTISTVSLVLNFDKVQEAIDF